MEITLDERLKLKFSEFSNLQCPYQKSNHITLRQLDVWFKEAGIIDMQIITTTDTGILFSKYGSTRINFKEFVQFLKQLAQDKKEAPLDLIKKLIECKVPNVDMASGDAPQSKRDAVIVPMNTGFTTRFINKFRMKNSK